MLQTFIESLNYLNKSGKSLCLSGWVLGDVKSGNRISCGVTSPPPCAFFQSIILPSHPHGRTENKVQIYILKGENFNMKAKADK